MCDSSDNEVELYCPQCGEDCEELVEGIAITVPLKTIANCKPTNGSKSGGTACQKKRRPDKYKTNLDSPADFSKTKRHRRRYEY